MWSVLERGSLSKITEAINFSFENEEALRR
jgi:hypothetical protein